MANRDGEVTFPINAKFPASKAVAAMRAYEAFLAENEPLLSKHGIRIGLQSLLHGHFWGIEPVHVLDAGRSAHTACATRPKIARAHATASSENRRDNRRGDRFPLSAHTHVPRHGLAACPVGESVSVRATRSQARPRGQLLDSLKDVTDPEHVINPGILGLN